MKFPRIAVGAPSVTCEELRRSIRESVRFRWMWRSTSGRWQLGEAAVAAVGCRRCRSKHPRAACWLRSRRQPVFTDDQLPQCLVTQTTALEHSCTSPAQNPTRPSYSPHSCCTNRSASLLSTNLLLPSIRPTSFPPPFASSMEHRPRPGYWLMTRPFSASSGRCNRNDT